LVVGSGSVVAPAASGGDLHTISATSFSTVSLSFGDWLRCAVVASSVLWLRELSKAITQTRSRKVVTCLVGN
jgi:hypothetical protein